MPKKTMEDKLQPAVRSSLMGSQVCSPFGLHEALIRCLFLDVRRKRIQYDESRAMIIDMRIP